MKIWKAFTIFIYVLLFKIGGLTVLRRTGQVRTFERRHIAGIIWVPYIEPFEFQGWDRDDGDPGKIPFTRESELKNADYLLANFERI